MMFGLGLGLRLGLGLYPELRPKTLYPPGCMLDKKEINIQQNQRTQAPLVKGLSLEGS